MIGVEQARTAAHSIAEAVLGEPVGQLDRIASRSHLVFLNSAVVVKLVDAADHARLDREIALASELPSGLSPPVLASGVLATTTGEVRYACLSRLPGAAPGMGLPGVDRDTARRWAQQAVRQLQRLHRWVPKEPAAAILRERLDHGGFTGRGRLLKDIDTVRGLDYRATVPRPILDGLAAIAGGGPEQAPARVPVHADCHWDNWLVHDHNVTTLLDFEWARFGDPLDDWMFVARFSGPHLLTVLDVIAEATATPLDTLRAGCELREAAHVTSDLRLALQESGGHAAAEAENLVRELHDIVIRHSWWQPGTG